MASSTRAKPAVPLLEFKDVTVFRGGKKVLDRLTLTVRQDENVAILGPNGSGKSTLIKAVIRECYPYAGPPDPVFKIFGRERWDIHGLRGLLGVVSPDIQQVHTAGEDLALDTVLSGFFSSVGIYRQKLTPAMQAKALRVMRFLGIADLSERKMNEMSLGEARKVLIARALCHDPLALILDEPTSGLDPGAAARFRSVIARIAARGKNIIMVTHDAGDIIPAINRVIMLRRGRIFRDGSPRSVLTAENLRTLFGFTSPSWRIAGTLPPADGRGRAARRARR